MKALHRRVIRLTERMRTQEGLQPYEVRTPDNRVEARIEPHTVKPACVVIWYDSRTLEPEEAKALIEAQIPDNAHLFIFPRPLSIEAWRERYAGNLN
jgi:hypothetical protein